MFAKTSHLPFAMGSVIQAMVTSSNRISRLTKCRLLIQLALLLRRWKVLPSCLEELVRELWFLHLALAPVRLQLRLRSLRPLDSAAVVESVKKTNRLVTAEEGWAFSGIGSELAALMMDEAFDWLDAPVRRVAGADVPMPYAANLEHLALPQAEDIVRAAKDVCYAG